ncbi:hypothetical protein NBG4_1390002 [Candidatus Sulfobium mesophilum]|uniref:Tyr recombinase domain-containing protein n=1 Tax=Candidatus Sulfobium mesophilum TaxID=2016548 RepID=A0A2U3QET7_9BACT|nr:hypothetical protein NBG4_1390002 [Candidatus Sulfobium mesophilum]
MRRVAGIKTRKNILNGLHAFFSWLKSKKIIEAIPEWPKISGSNAKARVAIDIETQNDGLSKIPEEHRDVLEFGFETGLRPGETCALLVGDVDLANNRVIIQRTWSGAHLKPSTKTNEEKYIPLSVRAREIVTEHKKDKLPATFLFINPNTGRCYRQKQLNNIWHTYIVVSQLHIMRHLVTRSAHRSHKPPELISLMPSF